MAGLVTRFKDFFARKDREAAQRSEEEQALQDELVGLENEARYHEEASYQADSARVRDVLERETRMLFYESKEPQRSQLQGRCQVMIERIERPGVVGARIGEVRERLRFLREQDPADTGSMVESATG